MAFAGDRLKRHSVSILLLVLVLYHHLDASFDRVRIPLGPQADITSQNGTKYESIQRCIDAVAASPAPRRCFVPSGTVNSSQVEMASGVRLVFGRGTFVNNSTQGGNFAFIHFGPRVIDASVSGEGQAITCLQNDPTKSQHQSVITDEGTNNYIGDVTLDANNNSTFALYHSVTATHPVVHNVQLIHLAPRLLDNVNMAYAWEIAGAVNGIATNIYCVGGPLDCLNLDSGPFASAKGHYTQSTRGWIFKNVTAVDSPSNGIDLGSQQANIPIADNIFFNVTTLGNGRVGSSGGADDRYGINLFNAENNIFVGVTSFNNYGSGIRFNSARNNVILDLTSENNGLQGPGTGDAVRIEHGSQARPNQGNFIQGIVRCSAGNNGIATRGENSFGNIFRVEAGNCKNFLSSPRDRALPQNQGHALRVRDFRLSKSWGRAAMIQSVRGINEAFSISVVAAAKVGPEPSVVLRFHNRTWPKSPTFVCLGDPAGTGTSKQWLVSSMSKRLLIIYSGIPEPTRTYSVSCAALRE